MKSFLHRHPDRGRKVKKGNPFLQAGSPPLYHDMKPEPLKAFHLRSSGASSFALLAVGAVAFGALAIGALAIGKLFLGKLFIRSARIDRLEIGELNVTGGDF
jgi:hypothetical protein